MWILVETQASAVGDASLRDICNWIWLKLAVLRLLR